MFGCSEGKAWHLLLMRNIFLCELTPWQSGWLRDSRMLLSISKSGRVKQLVSFGDWEVDQKIFHEFLLQTAHKSIGLVQSTWMFVLFLLPLVTDEI